MSKYLKAAVAALAVAAMAGPAFADSKISGYYRMQMITDTVNGAPAADKHAETQVDNRFRLRYQNNLSDLINFVYYGEVDTPWGQSSKGAIGNGGKASADGVNVETKNVYLDFKIPGSIVSVRTGIQGFADTFENTVVSDDMAGVTANLAFTPNFGTTFGYFKFDEGASKTKWDDVDFYALQNKLKVNDNLKLNVDFYYLDDNRDAPAKAAVPAVTAAGPGGVSTVTVTPAVAAVAEVPAVDLYTAGVSADAKAAGIGLTGFVAYQFGTADYQGQADQDINAWGASAKAKMEIGPAKTGLRLT